MIIKLLNIYLQGERVVAASRRPDGTMRKEIRIREGYTPLDEMQRYVPRALRNTAAAPKCPGLDDDLASAASASAKTQAAKKNEKRKEARKEKAESDVADQMKNLKYVLHVLPIPLYDLYV